jgi:hypothetical protein
LTVVNQPNAKAVVGRDVKLCEKAEAPKDVAPAEKKEAKKEQPKKEQPKKEQPKKVGAISGMLLVLSYHLYDEAQKKTVIPVRIFC